ncbi:hypothetical protein A5715_09650 [Mycolicibacter heraklionensis]|nr:hypothetical protein A5715_09650 [Mycolicibacter heraklionensis]
MSTYREAAALDEVFGRYRLRGLLGAGGMGEVYRAYDTELDREIAIKVLPPQASTDPTFEQRFRREARIAARLNEPHVVPIHDSGEIAGRLFIAMRLIDGTDVATLLDRHGPMPPEQAVAIIEQTAAALDAAHEAGLVHRDIKPANILLTPKDFVYLIDFGIAHAPGETQLTNTGAAIGTLAYMAPERFTTGQVDKHADIYALTCVLHECLTGSKPYPDNGIEQQIFAHINGPPPRPSTITPDIARGFDDVIATGMAAQPEQRFHHAGELASAARAALHAAPTRTPPVVAAAPAGRFTQPAALSPVAATQFSAAPPRAIAAPQGPNPPSAPFDVVQRTRRRRRWVVALAVAAVLILATATGITHRTNKPPIATTINVGNNPDRVAIDPATHTAYITNLGDGTVSVIDTTTNTLTTTIPVGRGPAAVAIDPNTHTAYITNNLDDTVSVIDTTTNTLTTTIPVGLHPADVAIDPNTHTAYITNNHGDTVSVITRGP